MCFGFRIRYDIMDDTLIKYSISNCAISYLEFHRKWTTIAVETVETQVMSRYLSISMPLAVSSSHKWKPLFSRWPNNTCQTNAILESGFNLSQRYRNMSFCSIIVQLYPLVSRMGLGCWELLVCSLRIQAFWLGPVTFCASVLMSSWHHQQINPGWRSAAISTTTPQLCFFLVAWVLTRVIMAVS
jgi:hypothetical protein